jgi:hypothetical protein
LRTSVSKIDRRRLDRCVGVYRYDPADLSGRFSARQTSKAKQRVGFASRSCHLRWWLGGA